MDRITILATVAVLLALPACDKKGHADEDTSTDTVGDTATDAESDAIPDTTDDDVAADTTTDAPEEELPPACTYAPGPYGTVLGNVLADLHWQPANTPAIDIAGADGSFDLCDLYADSVTNGGTLTGALVFVTTGWCPYCAEEAPKLEGLLDELSSQGIIVIGLVTQTSTGAAADAAYAASYATSHGWTDVVAVAGADLPDAYWPPADVAADNVGVPLHLFIDLRNMRLYGRVAGAWEMKLFRPVLEDLATAPAWTASFGREFDFDCGTGSGLGWETEPNMMGETPEDGSTLPFTMSATGCEPDIGDGLMLDEDDIDLGTVAAGTVLQVTSTATAGSGYYPFFEALRMNAAGTGFDWSTLGPSFMDGGVAQRQWILDVTGHYVVAAIDGRLVAGSYYAGGTSPAEDQCCEGGSTYTYDIDVSTTTLATTGDPLVVNTPFTTTFDTGDLDVYEFAAIGSTAYTFLMESADYNKLDPYLYVYNPATTTLLGSNDDINTSGGIYNSQVALTPSEDTTLWVVAAYWGAWFNGSPGYTLTVSD